MSTTLVTYSLDDPGAVAVPRARVTVQLAPPGVLADLAADGVVVGPREVATDDTGALQVALIPNAEYRTPGTHYVLRIRRGPTYTIVVPVSAVPVSLWSCRVDPATLEPAPPDAPTVYLLRAERGAPDGVASLGPDGKVPAGQLPAGGGGVTDHGQLDGLSDHDHTQYVLTTRQVIAGTGLTGGGTLTTDRTLAVAYGTTSTTAARGDDARITGALQATLVDAKGDLLAGSAADAVARLAVGSDGQVLTADSGEATGLRWATPASGGGVDLVAATYGCLALTFGPVGVGGNATQEIRIAEDRSIVVRLALPAGTLVSGIRLPVAGLTTTNGDLFGTVYHADGTVLGTTADVSGALSTGDAQVWRDIPLPAPAELIGDQLYVALTNTVPTSESLQVVICQFDGAGQIPLWLFDGAAFRLDGLSAPADPLVPSAGTPYWAPCIGVY